MPERKAWTQLQDSTLKYLREQRKVAKWAQIARLMQTEFGLPGRTGKQCRQRYHNHLDSTIVNSTWTPAEDSLLFKLHEEIGNKWSAIAQNLPGRSDNCVKNHFYSKLRKALRLLNKLISGNFPHHRQIQDSLLSRIVATMESKFHHDSKSDEELAQFCNDIKNRLVHLEGSQQDLEFIGNLLTDIQQFDRDCRKAYKGHKDDCEHQYKTYLKPPKPLLRICSTRSFSSEKSEDSSSSYLSSSSCYSSSDLSECQPQIQPKKAEKSLGRTSGRNSQEIPKQEQIEFQLKNHDLPEQKQMHENALKPSIFALQYQALIMQDSQVYNINNAMSEINLQETPHIGRILAPLEMYAPFYLFENEEEERIQYEDHGEKMDFQ